MKKKIKENLGIIILIFISIVIHLIAMFSLGVKYSLNSDDLSYINSGIIFLRTGSITMHGYISAQIMPGMTYFIAFISLLFGQGTLFYLILKFIWMIISILSLIGVYKIIRIYSNKIFSLIGASFLLVVDFIWMDNLILTETPFMCCFIWMIYFSLKMVNAKDWKYFWGLIVCYILAIMFKANIAIYPIFLFVYMMLKKYNWKLILKQGLIGAGITIAVLSPWIIRNYIQFNRFIPLTYGAGNPLLLGTYQGNYYPPDEKMDYETNVNSKMPDEMKYYLSDQVDLHDKMRGYYSLEADEMKAKYRMHYWWSTDKIGMLKDYLYHKPLILVYNSFYWKELFGIPEGGILLIRKIEILLFLIAAFAIIINKKKFRDLFFMMIVYASQILVYSYTFAFSRYGQTLYFFRFIIIGIGLNVLYNRIRGIKDEVSD